MLSEEADLENLYERERQAAYESALQQEENYLQAIAREESKANGDDDYDVCYNESCDGLCSSLCYNHRGDYYRQNSCGKGNYLNYLTMEIKRIVKMIISKQSKRRSLKKSVKVRKITFRKAILIEVPAVMP